MLSQGRAGRRSEAGPDLPPVAPEKPLAEVWAEQAKRVRRQRAQRKSGEIAVKVLEVTVSIASEILNNWP